MEAAAPAYDTHQLVPSPLKVGVVIGSYNMPHVIELQIACIRYHGGGVPVLISDDCSDGLEPTPEPSSSFGRLAGLAARSRGVKLWPNAGRIGHAGGDLAAFWKGIVWGAATGLHVVFKLSQRYVIDIPHWAQDWGRRLMDSGLSTLGRDCKFHGFPLRTEAVGLRVDRWDRPDVLAHLTPRRINWAAEMVVFDDVRDRMEGELCDWELMSRARPQPAPGVLFRESNGPEDYRRLAAKYGLLGGEWDKFDCRDSTQMRDYVTG